jgi:hypothetical protein
VVTALSEQYDRRLLQPGANTADIINQYIATIRAIRYLEVR